MKSLAAVAMVAAVVLASCASSTLGPTVTDDARHVTTTTTAMLPRVPGAVDTAVDQANIATTICVPGYTKTVRPPVSYTNAIKVNLFKAEHAPGKISDYELDHMVPLELGGAPRDINNLWLQPWNGAGGAHQKDAAENRLHTEVCARTITLEAAQRAILDPSNWHT